MRRIRLLPVLFLPVLLVAPGCGDQDVTDPAAAPGEAASADPTEESPAPAEDTYAGIDDPATRAIPLTAVEGVADVRVWERSRHQENVTSVVVAAPSKGGGVQTLTLGSSTTVKKATSVQEVEYWSKHNGLTEGVAEILAPVVVDGVELHHARGRNAVEIVDGYLYADDEIAYRVIFTTPLHLSETQREEQIGRVLATLEFE